MEKKLIAIDLDGTTLNNNSELTQETIDTLHAVKNLGHEVAIVTGRPYRNSKQYYDQLNLGGQSQTSTVLSAIFQGCQIGMEIPYHSRFRIRT